MLNLQKCVVMETLEFIKKAEGGKIIIDVPENLEGKEVKIRVTEYNVLDHPEDWSTLPGAEKVKILERFAGTAKYPDTDTNKYDVYDQ
jgi:hypothetical protein